MLNSILEFDGKWRTYQGRVLDRADKYLKDGKIHIVAAPGSGKTTLGIELMRRLDSNALVFAPSVTIREQWVSRIKEAFLKKGIDADEYISQNLKEPKAITVATYQALHSAMVRFAGKLTEENDDESDEESQAKTEEVDFSKFDIVATMKKAQVKTLCLDECHHLRSEWWKALEEFKKKYQDDSVTTIALTATPPYDSTPALWKRYMDMCGDIDEEITVPELVKEGSLCPHQDFVYFNYPTQLEAAEIKKFEDRRDALVSELRYDKTLLGYIKTHRYLNNRANTEELLDNPGYLSSILIFLKENKNVYPMNLQRLLGADKLPEMDEKWMEYLLQGLLYEDTASYDVPQEYVNSMLARLKRDGLIENKHVSLVRNNKLEKQLAKSKGKCKSISEIVFNEYQKMGKDLRLLVLTDFIRKEYVKILGNLNEDCNHIGVIPFFEMLRRENEARGKDIRFGVLCGTIVIIPATAVEALQATLTEGERITISPIGNLSEQEYVSVNAVGDSHFLTGAVTQIFTEGHMEVLIGTKSLLGEGWDSPCINSLILASFVGSFMLSNQMRGRAIRVFKGNPEKTSNIWHLVCLKTTKQAKIDAIMDEGGTDDYKLLERRMEHFLGMHYEKESIESGMERLSIIKKPFDAENVAKINEGMLAIANDRETLRARWDAALKNFNKLEVTKQVGVQNSLVNSTAFDKLMGNSVIKGAVSAVGGAMCVKGLLAGGSILGLAGVAGAVAAVAGISLISKIPKLKRLSTAAGQAEGYGNGILTALKNQGLVDDKCKVVVDEDNEKGNYLSLQGGSSRDKEVFADSVAQLFAPVDNQRYLLVKSGSGKDKNGYYCVPECFAKKKEDAQDFYECMKEYMGNYELVYTRNEQGRRVLLDGRVNCIANKKAQLKSYDKVKSALE